MLRVRIARACDHDAPHCSCRPLVQCWTGAHVGVVFSAAIYLPLFVVWSFLMAVVFIDRIPDPTGKKNPLSAAHGEPAVQ